jgi:predicted RNA-binding Zn-ribbon protein involved in translation (DUF1610 family)
MAEKIVDNTKGSPKASMPKKCPNCGMLNPFVLDVCRKCKTPLPAPKQVFVCHICGEEVYEDEPKCSSCGLSISEIKAKSQFVGDR